MHDLDQEAGRLAAGQHGLITRSQALALGFTSSAIARRRANARWLTVAEGVYQIHGAPMGWHAEILTGCLAHRGFATHRSSAALHGVDGFGLTIGEISVPRGSRPDHSGLIVHESTDLFLFEPMVIQSIPTTPISRLIVDLGAVISFERYERVVEELIRREKLTWDVAFDQLVLHSRQGRNGVGPLRALLDERFGADVGESVFEGGFDRALSRTELPRPLPQFRVFDANGFIARVDYAYPAIKVAIELDGRRFHGDAVFERDRDKRFRLTTAGWQVVEVTWAMFVGNPGLVFRRLAKIIRDREGELGRSAVPHPKFHPR